MDWNLFMFYMDVGGVTMWAIVFLSVLGVSIVFERFFFFMRNSRRPFILDLPNECGEDKIRSALERKINSTIFEWERNLSFLEVIIRVAPMLGLFGTVLGMVKMFQALADGGAITAVAVTRGIQEALFTTVAGLACAIPLMIGHGFLLAKIESYEAYLYSQADVYESVKNGNARS